MISLQVSSGIKFITVMFLQLFIGCEDGNTYDENGLLTNSAPPTIDTIQEVVAPDSALLTSSTAAYTIEAADTSKVNTKSVSPDEVVTYAEAQVGIPYRYGSTDPKIGFDCSGFITYVFNHFNIKVPRSSVDFTDVGKAVPVEEARRGDLILFTGTNRNIRVVGHMGIVLTNDSGEIKFIHSSSGKANGVTVTPLNGYYQGRFVSIRRIFP